MVFEKAFLIEPGYTGSIRSKIETLSRVVTAGSEGVSSGVSYIVFCLSLKLSKAAETQRMSHRGFQSLCHIRVRTVQLPPTSL